MSLIVSPYLLAAATSWLAAQGLKYLLQMGKPTPSGRRYRYLYVSGNMPSAHTATMVALTTVIGLRDGIESGLFALAVAITSVVAYDAMMSRRSAGEQGLALTRLLKASPKTADPLPYVALGHKPLEVAAGGLLGLAIGVAIAFFTMI